MKKAAQKSAPVNLGTKRTCIKCSAKFYDFAKEEISCPKCKAIMTAEDFVLSVPLKAESKRQKASEKVAPEALVGSDDAADGPEPFESVEELADGEDDLVDDLATDDGDDNEY